MAREYILVNYYLCSIYLWVLCGDSMNVNEVGYMLHKLDKVSDELLRDYFAGQAIAAIIIGNDADECTIGLGAAKDAYAVADAMMEARLPLLEAK